MAVNGGFFTCIGRGHGAPCQPAGREAWEQMRRELWLAQMCERIEKGDEALKHRLPVWTPHCAAFRGGHRAIADAVRPLPRLMLDFDEKGHTEEIFQRLMDGSPLVVLLVEESVRRGTHVLVELPEGMTAEEAQRLMAEATGFEPDKAVKDVARCIYMVSEGHTRFVSERLFEVGGDRVDRFDRFDRSNGLDRSDRSNGSNRSDGQLPIEPIQPNKPIRPNKPIEPIKPINPTFKGTPYADIIAEWWRRGGGEPAEGERNVKLHQLAVNLRAICDNRKELLMAVMPRLGLAEQELRAIVDSACKEPPKGISRAMLAVLSALEDGQAADGDEATTTEKAGGMTMSVKALPIGLRESLVGVPAAMQMPVLCAVLPIAAAYADQVTVDYCDGNRQRLGLMSIIRGEQASGKSVCKNAVDVWKRQLDEEDALARRREEEWKERKKGRKANEKAPEDPKVLIRMVPVTVSCSTLLKRFKNAGGHCLYSFGEELDTLRKTNGAGSWSSKYDIYRLSFDNGEWGQDYNSDAAESGVVNVAYNWTMLGTNGALKKCFRTDNIENGLSSRILVAEMPDSSFSRMPKFGRRSAEDEARIREAATRLREATGVIDVPRLRRAIEDWVEEKRVEAAKDIDHVKDTYRKRAAVIGFRCGVVFHLLTGRDRESKQCLEFALMMADYCLEQQIKTFGEALMNQYVDASSEGQRNGVNSSVFDRLPPTFTTSDLRALKRESCSDSAIRMIILRWTRDGWIEKTDRSHWTKTKVEGQTA